MKADLVRVRGHKVPSEGIHPPSLEGAREIPSHRAASSKMRIMERS